MSHRELTRDALTRAPTMRAAAASDWDAIARLLADAGLPLAGAEAHVTDFVLAEDDGPLAGCAALERYGDVALLRSVAVAADARGTGLGVALVDAAIARARRGGVRTLVLLTTTAERFFPRFGFQTVGRDGVPDAVRASAEFRGACPASATVMRLDLQGPDAPLTIRDARREDAAAIAAIYNEGIAARVATFETRERSADDVAAWFDDARFPRFVAERGERVVGWVTASGYRPRDCYAGIAEFSVYVASSERGRRVGDALVAAFLPACEAAGFWKVLSRIFPENAASRALCRRHGFREVGTYEKHAKLDGVWRDVVIVERLLGDALGEPLSSAAALRIASESIASPDATALIGALNAELSARYPEPGATHFRLDPTEVAPGNGCFVVARQAGCAVACGALRRLRDEGSLRELGTDVGELKRMYVAPELRGRGIGRALVARLEAEARALGMTRLVLETGTRQAEALALYRRSGFVDIPPYGEYAASPDTSVCLAKPL